MPFNKNIAYNELPLLPPASDLETREVLKKAIAASRALSEVKGTLRRLPNPTLFVDSIHLQEARASSAIENIVTTHDELFLSSVASLKEENPAIKEVLHYKEALWYGLNELDRKPILNTNLFIRIVQIIKKNEAGIRNAPGTQLKNPSTGRVVYTPPFGEDVIREKLKNLEDFIHANDELDPLVKMAVIHYQFEAIHPFFDGNGRTGRIILLLYLKLCGLLDVPALFLSRYIIENKQAYYKKLRGVTENGNWEDWILYMLAMIEESSIKDRDRILRIEALMNEIGNRLRDQLPGIYSRELVEALFRLPYTKRQRLADAGLGTLKTVGNYLMELKGAGFLSSQQVGKEKIYLNPPLLEILRQ